MRKLSLFGAACLMAFTLPVLSTSTASMNGAADELLGVVPDELVYADIFACPRPELVLDFLAHGIGVDQRECSVLSREEVDLMIPVDTVYAATYDAWFAGETDEPGEPYELMQLHLIKVDGLRLYAVSPVMIDEHFLDESIIGEEFVISFGLNRNGVAYEQWPTALPGVPAAIA